MNSAYTKTIGGCRECGGYLVITAGGLLFCQKCQPNLPEEYYTETMEFLNGKRKAIFRNAE